LNPVFILSRLGAAHYIGRDFLSRARMREIDSLCVAAGGLELLGPMAREARVGMEDLLNAYLPILIFLIIAGLLTLFLVGASLILAKQNPDPEKLSSYECGFAAFDDARRQFDVRFYLVSILFIIFDLEVAFLFPWAVSLGNIGLFGFWSMMIFLGVLTVGFVYEWKKGALEWE
jgi:NADH-quinone oxidoreductase subunit A